MTPDDVRDAFPEFAEATDGMIEGAIRGASAKVDAATAGTSYERLLGLRVAQILARSPFARNMTLVLKDGRTIYDDETTELTMLVAVGQRTFT